MEKGKAYDDDGRAFEGHHMKSAESYPEYQGDPDNIQFLTRAEHKAAHGGDFHNATNGYYDPSTNMTVEFGNELTSCSIVDLSDPVYAVIQEDQISNNNSADNMCPASDDQTITVHVETLSPVTKKHSFFARTWDGIKAFPTKHPKLFTVGKIAAVVIPSVLKAVGDYSESNSRNDSENVSLNSYNFQDDPNRAVDSPDVAKDNIVYTAHRSSPEEHTVRASGQHYNTKNGRIWKEKEAYSRGGKKNH